MSTTTNDVLAALVKRISGLSDVEALLQQRIVSEAPILSEISQYLLHLGGKRIRPLLVLLCAQACGAAKPESAVVQVAAGIELIHMATLLHDDIIDRSPKRRGKEAPWLKFGANDTLICGDFLLSRAFHLCAQLPAKIIEETHIACIELTEGEVTEVSLAQRDAGLMGCLEIARKKTASLFRLAALSGAFCAGAPAAAVQDFARFGEALGIAFQGLDDILDVVGDEALLGKRPGVDIRERKPSLVNVLALESTDPALVPVQQVLRSATEPTDDQVATSLEILRNSVVISQARSTATSYAHTARAALQQAVAGCPNASDMYAELLEQVIVYTIDRLR